MPIRERTPIKLRDPAICLFSPEDRKLPNRVVSTASLQLIQDLEVAPEQYLALKFHVRIRAPELCPHCTSRGALWALGYYFRNLTAAGSGVLRLPVRRFRCKVCRKTASILPSFAQPYRLVQNSTIEKYVAGVRDFDVSRWLGLLRRYWRRFTRSLPDLQSLVLADRGRAPPCDDPALWWRFLISGHSNFATATMVVVLRFGVTFFGRYRCHQANSGSE